VYRAGNVNGNVWTEVFSGYVSYDYQVQGKAILLSNLRSHGTWELIENGSYSNGGPLTLYLGPGTYTCSGNTLRYYDPNGSTVSTRELPAPQPGS
jgi:hypothetical protein